MTKKELLAAIDRAIARARELDAFDPRPTPTRSQIVQRKENRRLDQMPIREQSPLIPAPILEPAVLSEPRPYRSHLCRRVTVKVVTIRRSWYLGEDEQVSIPYHLSGETRGTWEKCGSCDRAESYAIHTNLPPDVPAHELEMIPYVVGFRFIRTSSRRRGPRRGRRKPQPTHFYLA